MCIRDRLLALPNPPTAIFAANDDMAAGVVRVADRLGIKVPDELSVAGCDDVALAQLINPALTTINQPLASMAGAAVNSLIESIRSKEEASGTEILPADIRVRDSTAPPPA